MVNPNQEGPYKERIPQDTCINDKERPSLPRNECQLYTNIKTPKPSQTMVHTIYPNSGTLELWKFSNLTFGEYLADSIPVLSAMSSLFLFCKFCLEHVRTVRLTDDFWHHQYICVRIYIYIYRYISLVLQSNSGVFSIVEDHESRLLSINGGWCIWRRGLRWKLNWDLKYDFSKKIKYYLNSILLL